MSLVSYNTPYDRAKAILAEFVAFADARSYSLPTRQYAQIGDIVRDCASVIVAATNLTPDPTYEPVACVSPRLSTFLVEIIRPCATVHDNDGLTIPALVDTVSEQAGLDGQLLYEFAQELAGWSNKQPWSVVWGFADGGLQVASLQVTIGIP